MGAPSNTGSGSGPVSSCSGWMELGSSSCDAAEYLATDGLNLVDAL
jgi:hypothetical protein